MADTAPAIQGLDYYASKLFAPTSSYKQDNDSDAELKLAGFPSSYSGERVWTGDEMKAKEDEWVTVLSEQDRAHIVEALRYFQGSSPIALTSIIVIDN